MTPEVIQAAASIPLWVAACIFVAVIVARIVRLLTTPIDHEGNPHDR